MAQLQDLTAQAPAVARRREMANIDRRAIIGFGIVVLIGILAAAIFLGSGASQQVGTTTTTTAAGAGAIDGWFPAVSAANREQRMAEAAATVDGWSSALLRPEPTVVDGWASRYLAGDE